MTPEGFLAYPLRSLAKWAGIPYDGEFRNGHAAHIFAGWALTLTLGLITQWGPLGSVLIPLLRELEDSKGSLKNWNRKSTADVLTFTIGNIIGYICLILIG